jgi:hypothetical protein
MEGGALARGRVFGVRSMRLAFAALVATRFALLLAFFRCLGAPGVLVGRRIGFGRRIGARFGRNGTIGGRRSGRIGCVRFFSSASSPALFRLRRRRAFCWRCIALRRPCVVGVVGAVVAVRFGVVAASLGALCVDPSSLGIGIGPPFRVDGRRGFSGRFGRFGQCARSCFVARRWIGYRSVLGSGTGLRAFGCLRRISRNDVVRLRNHALSRNGRRNISHEKATCEPRLNSPLTGCTSN